MRFTLAALALLVLAACDSSEPVGYYQATVTGEVSADLVGTASFRPEQGSLYLNSLPEGIRFSLPAGSVAVGRYSVVVQEPGEVLGAGEVAVLVELERPGGGFVAYLGFSGEVTVEAASDEAVSGRFTLQAADAREPVFTIEVSGQFDAVRAGILD